MCAMPGCNNRNSRSAPSPHIVSCRSFVLHVLYMCVNCECRYSLIFCAHIHILHISESVRLRLDIRFTLPISQLHSFPFFPFHSVRCEFRFVQQYEKLITAMEKFEDSCDAIYAFGIRQLCETIHFVLVRDIGRLFHISGNFSHLENRFK